MPLRLKAQMWTLHSITTVLLTVGLCTAAVAQSKAPPLPSGSTPHATLASAGVRFVPWRDPKEGAFTVSVPEGWQLSGGLYRAAAIDVRPVVEIQSPDGLMR